MTAFFVGLYNFLFCSVLLTFTGEINQRNQENEVPLWRVLSKESSGFKNFYERKARVSRLLKVNIWGILFANNEQFLFVFHIYVRSRNTRWTGNRGEQSECDGIYFLISHVCKKSMFCIQNMTHSLEEGRTQPHQTSQLTNTAAHHHFLVLTISNEIIEHMVNVVWNIVFHHLNPWNNPTWPFIGSVNVPAGIIKSECHVIISNIWGYGNMKW